MELSELEKLYEQVKLSQDQESDIERTTRACGQLAGFLNMNLNSGKNKDKALGYVEMAMLYAKRSIELDG